MIELTLVAFQAVLLGLFVFMFTRLENRIENHIEKRIDSLANDVSTLRQEIHTDSLSLRRDLAEEFRAQRAEAAAQIAAIAAAINAGRS